MDRKHTITLTETQLRMVIDALDLVTEDWPYALTEDGPGAVEALADSIRMQYEPILDWDR